MPEGHKPVCIHLYDHCFNGFVFFNNKDSIFNTYFSIRKATLTEDLPISGAWVVETVTLEANEIIVGVVAELYSGRQYFYTHIH